MIIASEVYDLIPTNGRKSFNGKAKVIVAGNYKYLKSYDTIIGYKDRNGKAHRLSDYRSNTTDCHIKAFFGDGKAFRALPLETRNYEICVSL